MKRAIGPAEVLAFIGVLMLLVGLGHFSPDLAMGVLSIMGLICLLGGLFAAWRVAQRREAE